MIKIIDKINTTYPVKIYIITCYDKKYNVSEIFLLLVIESLLSQVCCVTIVLDSDAEIELTE